MKQRIIPILSILVGLLAFGLTYQYLSSKQKELKAEYDRIYAGARKIAVVAASHDIPGQTVIRRTDIGRIEIYESQASDRTITPDQATLIIGRKTQFGIKALDAILWSDLEGGAPSDMGLAGIVTHGMRAISLSVGGAQAVSGMVRANDHIDILGTFTFPSKTVPGEMETVTLTVLQDVTVLAAGQQLARNMRSDRSSGGSSYRSVTIEVTPREAELLVFAQQAKGSLTLSLRSPTDGTFETDLPIIDFDHLQNKLPELNEYRQRIIRKRNP